jgi:hypothetical protein
MSAVRASIRPQEMAAGLSDAEAARLGRFASP